MKFLIITILLTLSSLAEECYYIYRAYITDVYDGDTVTAVIDLGFNVSTIQKIRLLGIDTPELRGSEYTEGLKARDYLRSLILNKEVTLETFKDKKGKYGRYLGIIYLEETNINKLLLKEGYAKEYK